MSENTLTMRAPDVDRLLRYSTPWNATTGLCRLRVWWRERTIVVTELDDNPGMSITNAIEYVAEAVEATLGVQLDVDDAPALIEHYPAAYHRGPTIDRVFFGGRNRDGRLERPYWRPATLSYPWLYEALT